MNAPTPGAPGSASDSNDLREQRKQLASVGVRLQGYAPRIAQFNQADAAEGFPVDEVSVTSATLYFC
jgi:hypothetical protein